MLTDKYWLFLYLTIRVYHLHYLLIRFSLYQSLDYMRIYSFSSSQFFIHLHKFMRLMIKLQSLILRREAIFDESFRYFATREFHNFLKIDISNIIHNPFNLDMIDIDARGHAQVMHYFVRHQFHIVSWLTYHHLMTKLIICVNILPTLIVFCPSSNHYHSFFFCAVVNLVVNGIGS